MRSEANGAVHLQLPKIFELEPDPRLDPKRSARRAGLRYVDEREVGLHRRRRGRGFSYVDAQRHVVRDRATLERIRSLAIPPAWTDVWICADDEGHLQATGRDAKRRKQYRYHTEFRAIRDETKFERIFDFAKELPRVRAYCQRALQTQGLSRDKVVAAVLTLLDQTLVRVGNEEYCRLNQSFGLTTLRDRHVRVRGARIELRFVGKSGKACTVTVNDRRLARVVQRCQDMPGEHLFEYLDDDGVGRSIGSSDVNETLRAITGQDLTAKDFRTWAATVLAAQELAGIGTCESATKRKRCITDAIKSVAARLNNTVAVCRKSYVHPGVLTAYENGLVVPPARGRSSGTGLRPDERAVLAFLSSATRAQGASSRAPASHLKLVPTSRSSARRSRAARPAATAADRARGKTRPRRASRARR